jgi:hypothetical protein
LIFKKGTLTKEEGRLSTADILILTSLEQLLLTFQTLFTLFTKQATLMRRSTVLSLPLQVVFPGLSYNPFSSVKHSKLDRLSLLVFYASLVKRERLVTQLLGCDKKGW